jgi:hypothetical protein
MVLADELLQLRDQLAKAPSPVQRMKLLARAWRTLRELDPRERKRLLAAVGSEGAQEILEKLSAKRGRITPAFLLQALDRLKSTDTEQLTDLVEALRDPDRRGEALRRGTLAISDVLTGEEGAIEPPQAEIEPAVAEARPEPPAPAAVRITPEVATPKEVEKPEVPPEEADPVELPAASSPPPVPLRSSTAQTGPEAPSLGLVDRVAEAPSLMSRLRFVRENLDDAVGLDVGQLRALIVLFPQDWARRRVLAELLKRKIPGDLYQAIYLVESLESRASRRWCVSVLLHEWDLTENERTALMERVDLPIGGYKNFDRSGKPAVADRSEREFVSPAAR